jgi:hypothetical protein
LGLDHRPEELALDAAPAGVELAEDLRVAVAERVPVVDEEQLLLDPERKAREPAEVAVPGLGEARP